MRFCTFVAKISMYSIFRFCLIITALCSISACLIFEDEPFPEPPSHCSNGVYDPDVEEGIDCGVICQTECPDPTCDDGIQNGNENGIDCGGWACAILCYTEPTCNTPTNTIISQGEGTFVFANGGSASASSSTDYSAVGQKQASNVKMWIYLNDLDEYNQSQTVNDELYASNPGEIELEIRFGTTSFPSSPSYSTQSPIPLEYHPQSNSFTLHFCENNLSGSGSNLWDPGAITGSITFSID